MKPAKKAGIGKRRNFPSTTTEDGSGAFDASQIEVLDAAECMIADIGNLPSGIRVITGNLSM